MFTRPEVNQKFREAINQYCEAMEYHDLNLTDEELLQLYTYVGSTPVSPEARNGDPYLPLHFEIKRGLARCYAFELILRANKNQRAAHDAFIKDQNPAVSLSRGSFERLLEDASSLTDDMKVSLRAGCFLTINNTIKEILDKESLGYPSDSEMFLSWLMPELQKNPSLLPISSKLTQNQLAIMQKMFWPGAHFRHMLFTEGGDAMTKSLAEGVQQSEFSEKDFLVWRWRWLTNLFGFQVGKGAKYYDEEVHSLSAMVIEKVYGCSFDRAVDGYLDAYLLARAEKAGLTQKPDLTESESKLLGHLAAYFNVLNVLTPARGEAIYRGYVACRDAFPELLSLADLYEAHRKDAFTITPTYVPAVLNSAFSVFKDLNSSEEESIQQATQFMCQVLSSLYILPHDQRISCMTLAKVDTLKAIFPRWKENHNAFEFNLNDQGELMVAEAAPQLSLRKRN